MRVGIRRGVVYTSAVPGVSAVADALYPELPAGGAVGVDPGKSGAISYVCGNVALTWKLADMTDRDVLDRLQWLSGVADRAVIERVASRPGQGVASTFKFGMSYGALCMALTASGIPWERVTPAKWQTALGCRTGGDKNVTKAKAQELFPSTKITHAIADAILLGVWVSRTCEVNAHNG